MKKIAIAQTQLQEVVEYINTLLESLDIENEETLEYINKGYEDLIQPIINIAFDGKNVIDKYVIAKQVDIEMFKENLENIYNVNVTNITDEQIVKMFDDVQEELANDDQYAEIYNEAIYHTLKQYNVKGI